ncbi:MAG TPA: serine/threonine-protein kinase [Polyangiaceae bacterium]
MLRASPPLRAGQKLGRYELIAPVARGGMGQVWAGRLRGARGFHKLVAIKTLLPPAAGDSARMEQRLLDEARIAALIQHSNVAQTLELGEHEGTLYLVMEWVDGEPLSDVLSSAEQVGGIPHLVAVNLVSQALRGLQAAHELCDESGRPLGIVHRDISPSNVLVSYSGIAKLVDFGIAQATNQRTSFGDSELEGKFSYMAPEQVLGAAVDRRTDLFAVGVMLYTLTTGRHPFAGADSSEMLRNIVSDEPPIRPSLRKPNYSRTLEAVVLKALEKEREGRWLSAEEMRLALQRGVPQAFELGFEAQLRNFMGDTVGDRALRKRETLRRAELAVDALAAEPKPSGTSISQTSLRGISVDTSGLTDSLRPLAPRVSHFPTLRPSPSSSSKAPAPRRRVARSLAVGALAVAALVFGLVWLRPLRSTPQAATSPGTGMVDLTPPRAPSAAVPPVISASASVAPSARLPVKAPR